MASPLHVLVYGALDAGVCDLYRFGMHRAVLAARGVELRGLTSYDLRVPTRQAGSADQAMASEEAVLDRSDIDWADVIVFRRFYVSQWNCADCALVSPIRRDMEGHRATTGHKIAEPDRLIRRLFGALDAYPELLRGRAVVYETDDDLLSVKSWNGLARRIAPEREIVERLLRRADLVTVSTPVLAERFRPFNDTIRVVRNAIDPAWYADQAREPAPPGDPRLLYYAGPERIRDYDVCRKAVDAVVDSFPDARRVWLGAIDAPSGGPPQRAIAAVDEVRPYVRGAAAFARSLVDARPDIGLAPLVGDEFDQAKSELHWLEYTMAGAATVATRMPEGGPFDAIRDGVDGLLATDYEEWLDALTRLAASPALREELAGRARERVLAEYTVEVRADEWADAYRWAADHAGRSAGGRVHGLGELPAEAIEDEARASLAHRRRIRDAAETASTSLARLRGDRAMCWLPGEAVDPLVSVIVPVVDEPAELVTCAVISALAGSHRNLVVIVAAPAGPGLDRLARLAAIPRVRLVSVEPPARLPVAGSAAARSAWTGHLLDAAERAAAGAWISPLSPEAAFDPNHIEILLSVLVQNRLEFVYGQAVIDLGAGRQAVLGAWPPNPDGVLTIGTELYARSLSQVARFDAEAWREAETPGWAMWRSLAAAGVRMASIEAPVTWLTATGAGAIPWPTATAAADDEHPVDPLARTTGPTFRDRRTRRRDVRQARGSASTPARGQP